MRKYLFKNFLKSFLFFLFFLILIFISFSLWDKRIKGQISEISGIKNLNQKNQDLISNYNNLLNQRILAVDKIKKIENLFFSKEEALTFRDKIKSFMSIYNLFGEVNYFFTENEIKFTLIIDGSNFNQKIKNINSFLNFIKKNKLVSIDKINYDGSFQITGTFFIR